MSGNTPFNKEKYKNAILYFIRHGGIDMTKEKLQCLLYYLDFTFFEKYGRSVTGETYIKK